MRHYFTLVLLTISVIAWADEPATSDSETKSPPSKTPFSTASVKVSEVEITASEPQAPAAPPAVIQALNRIFKKVAMDQISISPAAIAGLYEVIVQAEIFYISADGKYLMMGEIRNSITGHNLTKEKRTGLRMKAVEALGEDEMVVFAPTDETKHTIYVFTDVDCPYCSKFHLEVPALNEAGVKVGYLAFPRAGAGSKTYNTMVSVWCAKDKQQAITDAKAGKEVKSVTCNHSIDKQYELGRKIGVTGTPALLLSNGELIPGYVPAARLIPFLDEKLSSPSEDEELHLDE
jgi:thiol:disulfide interchange protein DsbC